MPKGKKAAIKQIKLSHANIFRLDSCSHTLKRTCSGASAKSVLCHLLTHIHNISLSPAAHQGLGKLPGMKKICSLMAPFSCIWWHKMQLDFFWAVDNPNMLNDRVLSLLYSLFQDGSLGLLWQCWYQFSAAAQVHSADVKWIGMSCDRSFAVL